MVKFGGGDNTMSNFHRQKISCQSFPNLETDRYELSLYIAKVTKSIFVDSAIIMC